MQKRRHTEKSKTKPQKIQQLFIHVLGHWGGGSSRPLASLLCSSLLSWGLSRAEDDVHAAVRVHDAAELADLEAKATRDTRSEPNRVLRMNRRQRSAYVASSKGFCIMPRPNGPRSPPRVPLQGHQELVSGALQQHAVFAARVPAAVAVLHCQVGEGGISTHDHVAQA